MTTSTIAKFTIATILGLITAHFWSIGETRLAIFMMATILFQIFFIVGEEPENSCFTPESDGKFGKAMRKWRSNNLLKK